MQTSRTTERLFMTLLARSRLKKHEMSIARVTTHCDQMTMRSRKTVDERMMKATPAAYLRRKHAQGTQ